PPPPARWRLLPTSSAFNCPPPSLLAEALGFDWPSPDRSATSGMPAMGLAAPRSQAHFFGRAASGTNPKRQRWRAVPASDTSPTRQRGRAVASPRWRFGLVQCPYDAQPGEAAHTHTPLASI